jgi:hypothetical protein
METNSENERSVFNLVVLKFTEDTDKQRIDMGWSISQWPPDFGRLKAARWTYLKNHKISDSPPQDGLKTLCDSIIYSKSLY